MYIAYHSLLLRWFCRPSRAVSGVADEALFLGERRQLHEEAGTIGRAVRDVGNSHNRRPHSPLGEANHGGLHDVARPQGFLVLIAGGKGRGPPRWPVGPGFRASRCYPPRPTAWRFQRAPRRTPA